MEEFYQRWLKLQTKNDSGIGTQTAEVQKTPTDIIYENSQLKLILEKGVHKKQKIFRIEDHLFYVKIVPKTKNELPFLSDILDFLHAGFIHILDEIKLFYKKG